MVARNQKGRMGGGGMCGKEGSCGCSRRVLMVMELFCILTAAVVM